LARAIRDDAILVDGNPGALKEVPEEVMEPLFVMDPDIVNLER
jgi:hypothetical protein